MSVVPAVTVAEIYDDNVFFQPDGGFPEGAIVDEPEDDEDFITRITPSLAISGGWPRLSLFARADTGMEYYARNTDLNSSAARYSFATGGRYKLTPRAVLSADAGYARSKTALELNQIRAPRDPFASLGSTTIAVPPTAAPPPGTVNSGLFSRRARTEAITAGSSLHYDLSPLASLTTTYRYGRTEQRRASTNTTHVGSATLGRKVSERDTLFATGGVRRFEFEGGRFGGDEDQTSEFVTVGWTRSFSPRLTGTIGGGARFTDGDVDPEAFASLDYVLQRGALGAAYYRTQTTTVGESAVLDSDILSAYGLYRPWPLVGIRADGSFARSERSGAGGDTESYRGQVTASRVLLSWLAIGAGYQYLRQDGPIGFGGVFVFDDSAKVERNTVGLFLYAAFGFGTSERDPGAVLDHVAPDW